MPFFLLRARWLNPVAPKLLYWCIPFQRAYRDLNAVKMKRENADAYKVSAL